MIYTDYYDSDEFNRAFNEIVKLDNSGVDPYYNLDYSHNLKYKLDKKGYLYFILGKYTVNTLFNEYVCDFLNNHPYVWNYNVAGAEKNLNTSLGHVHFSLCVNSVKDAYFKSSDKHIFDILCDVYAGKYRSRCHEISSILGVNGDYVVTAFVNSPVKNYKFLHSFVQKGDEVLDFSKNVKMSKDEYYDLLSPDVVSKIDGNRLISDIMFVSHNYPPMTPKDFLVRHNQLVLRI